MLDVHVGAGAGARGDDETEESDEREETGEPRDHEEVQQPAHDVEGEVDEGGDDPDDQGDEHALDEVVVVFEVVLELFWEHELRHAVDELEDLVVVDVVVEQVSEVELLDATGRSAVGDVARRVGEAVGPQPDVDVRGQAERAERERRRGRRHVGEHGVDVEVREVELSGVNFVDGVVVAGGTGARDNGENERGEREERGGDQRAEVGHGYGKMKEWRLETGG